MEWTSEEIVQRALYQLEQMKGSGCYDIGKLESILKGKA
ncbi:hypothetical protein SEA_ATUIN_145 [Arthrobacter phage Atuin]|nr:hypothetical protein SEA_ATUIN_244 [Arthrobacter phage Atuin]